MGIEDMGRRSKYWSGTTHGKKKVEDDEFIRIELEGRRNKWPAGRIATEMGITYYGYKKRLLKLKNEIDKRWLAETSGMKPEELKFCEDLANGMHAGRAGMILKPGVFDVSYGRDVARELKGRKDIQDMLRLLFEQKGIGLDKRVERIKDHIENLDANVSLKALDMSFRLDGTMAKEVNYGGNIVNNIGFDLSAYEMRPSVVEVKEVKE